ncbi:MAG: NUDIX domain-containing protein [Paracoccus sp. (in: a-proteobacteria)]
MSYRDMLLAGPLAAPELLEALGLHGEPVTLPGFLSGGGEAGLGGDWPAWHDGPGRIAATRVARHPGLLRYLEIMGLSPMDIGGREVWGFGAGGGAEWSADHAGLMAAVAETVLARPLDIPAAQIALRLPRIAEIVSGRLRARAELSPTEYLPAPDPERARIELRHEAYGRFFAVEEISLRHRRFDGDWSPRLEREVFISADAALLLPYDPVRDQVLLVSQFRVGPLARGQVQCWMLEPIAGRIDAGESAESAARREAVEEAGVEVGELYALPPYYPTPGANSEFLYPFVAAVDLSGRVSGQGFGLAEEGEDIATHVLPRTELTRLAVTGQLQCGPLMIMVLWLDREAGRIRAELART